MAKGTLIEKSVTVKAPPETVFRFFTAPADVREWLCDRALAEAKKGGAYHFEWMSGWWARGVFEKVKAPKVLAFTWFGPGEPKESKVEVALKRTGGATKVTLKHSGVGSTGNWKSARNEIEKGWTNSLENLKSVIETGIDLRFARRPVLGIGLEPVTPELAKKEGLQVKSGIWIGSVEKDSGAAKAGLQKGDIIVGLDGRTIDTYESLIMALQKHRANDTVKVRVNRSGRKQETPVTLGARPIQDLPATHEEAVTVLRKSREEMGAELDKLVAGADETQAEKKPAPEKWCAKEALAHLIMTETTSRTGLIGQFAGDVLDSNENITVYPEALKAIMSATPNVPLLTDRLKREMGETLSVFEALRPEFQAHRARYRRTYNDLKYLAEHARHHFKQFDLAMQGKPMA
ncbi:MAG: SRPBCC domain-containing protein [bacterium]